MSWSLKGKYVETCSCDLICPCNASLTHGAVYDFCRVVLAFDITAGENKGTDVSGLKVAAIADTPKGLTHGNWNISGFVHPKPSQQQAAKLSPVLSGPKSW